MNVEMQSTHISVHESQAVVHEKALSLAISTDDGDDSNLTVLDLRVQQQMTEFCFMEIDGVVTEADDISSLTEGMPWIRLLRHFIVIFKMDFNFCVLLILKFT
jgi:hypothetical protein